MCGNDLVDYPSVDPVLNEWHTFRAELAFIYYKYLLQKPTTKLLLLLLLHLNGKN